MNRLSLLVSVGVVVALASGCSSSSKPPTGKACVLNSECNNPLSCTFGKCHQACSVTRDCDPGQRCVKVSGGSVCQLAEEKSCPPAGACSQPLICAIDLLCHNSCTPTTAGTDCPTGQVCASGACAEPAEVGSDGMLKAADGGVATGGTGGATGGTGGATGGTGGATGGAGGADAGVDAPPSMGNGPCGVPETEPNDTRDMAVPIAAPIMFTSCIGTPQDVDFYVLTAPSDPGGGYYEFSVTGVMGFESDVTVSSVADNGEIGQLYADSDGQDLHGFLAAAAGQKYRLAIRGFINVGTAPQKYTLKVSYTKVADTFEPNDTKDTAKPITLGTPIMAFMHQGYRGGKIDVDDIEDWYTTTAVAGDVTAKIENVPTGFEAYIFIYDSTGKMTSGYSVNDGANAMVTLTGVAAGPVYINVKPFFVTPSDFFAKEKAPGMVPDQFTRQYKLTVTQ